MNTIKINIELLKSGGSEIHEQDMTLTDGIRRTFFVNKSTFKDESGERLGLVTVLQDIT